jgi:uncharacterized protein YsxB (DUF464 family)
MIKATIFRNNADELVGFEISGHAGFAERGQDIVCAAVSFLATTVVNSLEEQLSFEPYYDVEETKGHLLCYLPLEISDIDRQKSQVILKTLEIGLISIEQEYSQYVKLLQRRWTKC